MASAAISRVSRGMGRVGCVRSGGPPSPARPLRPRSAGGMQQSRCRRRRPPPAHAARRPRTPNHPPAGGCGGRSPSRGPGQRRRVRGGRRGGAPLSWPVQGRDCGDTVLPGGGEGRDGAIVTKTAGGGLSSRRGQGTLAGKAGRPRATSRPRATPRAEPAAPPGPRRVPSAATSWSTLSGSQRTPTTPTRCAWKTSAGRRCGLRARPGAVKRAAARTARAAAGRGRRRGVRAVWPLPLPALPPAPASNSSGLHLPPPGAPPSPLAGRSATSGGSWPRSWRHCWMRGIWS
jgi:hypothetical protein